MCQRERRFHRKRLEDFLAQLRTKLKEELKADLEKAMSNLKIPWWKKLFGIK